MVSTHLKNMLVKLDHFPKGWVKIKRQIQPPPRYICNPHHLVSRIIHVWYIYLHLMEFDCMYIYVYNYKYILNTSQIGSIFRLVTSFCPNKNPEIWPYFFLKPNIGAFSDDKAFLQLLKIRNQVKFSELQLDL